MPKTSKTQIRYLHGTINPGQRGHGFDCFILVDGRRYRSRQPTMEDAHRWIEMIEDRTAAHRPPMTKLQLADAQHALAILPRGYSLTDAVRAITATPTPTDIPLAEALERFLTARSLTAKEVTLTAYRQTVSRLERMIGGTVAAVTKAQVEALLVGMKPVTRNSQLRNLAAFFNWCKAEGLITATPTERVGQARTAEPPKGILHPPEVRRLLDAAVKLAPELVAYLCVGLFAGVRPAEAERLPPAKIGRDFILLDGEVTKTADTRTVRVRPNLRSWLEAFPPGPIPPKRQRRTILDRVIKEADIHWKHDCLRHSFATFAYEAEHDAALIASEMGHAGTSVFFRHYRAMAHPGEGKKYFSIMPSTCHRSKLKGQRKSNSSHKSREINGPS